MTIHSVCLTFSGLIGLPTVKKSLIPYKIGELSYVYFYSFSGIGKYQRKRHWSLLRAFRLSKIESTIEHLLSRSHQKSARSYHNGVPRHHPIENSLVAFPLWVPFFQSNLQCVFLRSHQYQKFPPPPSISHLQ